MGKIRFYFAASLDGYIADPHGGVGFLDPFHGEDHGYESFFSAIGTLVMGRDTYKFVEDYGSWPYRKTRTIVLTHRAIEHPVCELEARSVDDIASFSQELQAFADGDTWILGGGKVMGAFLAAGEVDSIEMTIVPVAIGSGIPMYAGNATIARRFTLVQVRQYPSGAVRIVYERPSTSSG